MTLDMNFNNDLLWCIFLGSTVPRQDNGAVHTVKKTKQIYINILSSLHKFNPHAQLRFGLFISASFLLSCLSLLVNRKTVVLRRKENETFGFEIQVTLLPAHLLSLSLFSSFFLHSFKHYMPA